MSKKDLVPKVALKPTTTQSFEKTFNSFLKFLNDKLPYIITSTINKKTRNRNSKN